MQKPKWKKDKGELVVDLHSYTQHLPKLMQIRNHLGLSFLLIGFLLRAQGSRIMGDLKPALLRKTIKRKKLPAVQLWSSSSTKG